MNRGYRKDQNITMLYALEADVCIHRKNIVIKIGENVYICDDVLWYIIYL